MRFISLFLSFFLHAAIFGLAIFWSQLGAHPVKLDVPVYYVDLINLSGVPGAPGHSDSAKKAAPKKAAAPAPKPAAPKATPIKEPAKPTAVSPKPKPKPKKAPKPVVASKDKPISPKKQDKPKKPASKKEPKKQPKKEVKKPEPPKKKQAATKPEPKRKTEKKKTAKETRRNRITPKKKTKPNVPTRNQILSQALQATQMDVAKQDKMDQDAVAKALADLRNSQQGGTGRGGRGSGTGGDGGGHEGAYLRAMTQIIKEHWAYPILNDKVVLQAQVEITLDSRGQIRNFILTRSSGRPDFDASTMKAVDETRLTEQLPEPPSDLRTIRINFNSQEL